MNSTISTAPQLGFDFQLGDPGKAFVNKLGTGQDIVTDSFAAAGSTAADSLASMYVDDRVLGLGKTNWRQLLNRAIAHGHTELYLSQDGRQGLRIPGYRFGPITRMPEHGPEYIKRTLLDRAIGKALKGDASVKSGRVRVSEVVKLEWVVDKAAVVNVYESRKLVCTLQVDFHNLPFGDGPVEEDVSSQAAYFAGLFEKQGLPDADMVGASCVQALNLLITDLGK